MGFMSCISASSRTTVLLLRREMYNDNDIGIIVVSEIRQAVTNERKTTRNARNTVQCEYLVMFLENLAKSSMI